MRQRRFVPQALIVALSAILVASALAAEPPSPTADANHLPPGHAENPIDAKQIRRQASELTEQVSERLPPGSPDAARPIVRNFIDEHLFAAMKRDGIPHAALSDDYEFCRRVYLDLTGRIPSPGQLTAFVADSAPDKRDQLIDSLLDSPAWIDHWAYWFGDQFRNCANRIGNASTKHFDRWVRDSLAANKPYDRFVTEMLTASASGSAWLPDSAPAAYLARWHIPADTMYSDRYEDTADEIIVQSSRLFLGINYQCISCHRGRGFLENVNLDLVNRSREDLWAMSAFFGNMRVRIVPYQDRFTITEDGAGYDTASKSSVRLHRDGTSPVHPTFLLTGEQADPSKPLRPQFARMLTTHPQFARATVNLIWKEMMTLGIVEPVDGFDLARQDPANPPPNPWPVQPANAALLDALARDFTDSGYDLKHLMRSIARSSAYQLSSRFDQPWEERYTPYFARRLIRPLTAEQLHDSIVDATKVYGDYRHQDLLYETDLPPTRYATQVPTPESINDSRAKAFLRVFGQSSREWDEPAQTGSILQAITLMNSPFVASKVESKESRAALLAASDAAPADIVRDLYLATLSRLPTQEEEQLAVGWISEDRAAGAADLQWVLLNKLDFIFNH